MVAKPAGQVGTETQDTGVKARQSQGADRAHGRRGNFEGEGERKDAEVRVQEREKAASYIVVTDEVGRTLDPKRRRLPEPAVHYHVQL